MKKSFLALISILFSINVFGQIDVSISSNIVPLETMHGDTISVCRDTTIIFKALATLGNDTVTNASFKWFFDDGNTLEDIGLDSVTYTYSQGGGYRVRLEVSDQAANFGYDILPVRIAPQAIFEGTDNGLPEDQYGICRGSSSTLTGIAFPYLWEDEPQYLIESMPAELSESMPYTGSFSFYEFNKDSVFTAGAVDSVCISIEHPNMGQLRVELLAPGGNSIILKDYAPLNTANLGEPQQNPEDGNGTPYRYCWSQHSTAGLMNDTELQTIPESDYLPEEDFNLLEGSSLNGEWLIQITDSVVSDTGYVYSREIIFSELVLPPVWTYRDSLISYTAIWEGSNNPITQIQILENGGVKGTAHASPAVYGNNAYKFTMLNHWSCSVDTTIGLPVERATFTADPPSGQAKLDVNFTSTTDWAAFHNWKPGDGTGSLTGEQAQHTYLEKGDYQLVYTAEDNSGCTDTDTLTIEVSVEPSELSIPNFFSPDDNGINDVLTITIEGMEKFNFTIVSRWGQKMFETSIQEEAQNGWDGTEPITGLKASPGVYFFIFKGVGKDKKEWEEKGTIHLLR